MSGESGPDPRVLVFDVNETLSDFTALRSRFEDVGAPADLMATWFAALLRDGFALTAAGTYGDFASLALDGLRTLLPVVPEWSGDTEAAARHIMDGLTHLEVHPDVAPGVRKLHEAGFRLVTMTNGNAALTRRLLAGAGLDEYFEAMLDVSGPRCWKPAPAAYRYAVEQAGVRPEQALMVAVHPWDVDGALRAGLAGAWLRRDAAVYPTTMTRPTYVVQDLPELAEVLVAARE
ncbi:haloacid dehalogenase type II [Streptomyces sp. NBC_00459]|uniref:haloacid dehalogenase type II n=1 Tax=Streptomyces sp. NBC_00459 TaxID=2975749 RepID=UPI002E190F93